jgi:hypothetical protein
LRLSSGRAAVAQLDNVIVQKPHRRLDLSTGPVLAAPAAFGDDGCDQRHSGKV